MTQQQQQQKKKGFADDIDRHVALQFKKAFDARPDLTLVEAAKSFGSTYQQLQKYLTGENRMSASKLYTAAKLLGVPIDYFFAHLEDKLTLIKKEIKE